MLQGGLRLEDVVLGTDKQAKTKHLLIWQEKVCWALLRTECAGSMQRDNSNGVVAKIHHLKTLH